MRLDLYLVRERLIASRSRAHRAIKNGFVTVDGRIILKPSFDVTSVNCVVVADYIDKPAGYWKLKDIQEAFKLIQIGDTVLDIGSSAGGFLWYAADLAKDVYAIEFSPSSKQLLDIVAKKHGNKVHVIYADAFSFNFKTLGVELDVILNDVTTSPKDSLELLFKSASILKVGGRALQVLKGKFKAKPIDDFLEQFAEHGFETLKLMTGQKEELYVIAEKQAADINAEEGI